MNVEWNRIVLGLLKMNLDGRLCWFLRCFINAHKLLNFMPERDTDYGVYN